VRNKKEIHGMTYIIWSEPNKHVSLEDQYGFVIVNDDKNTPFARRIYV
jgi:hypothetical protein